MQMTRSLLASLFLFQLSAAGCMTLDDSSDDAVDQSGSLTCQAKVLEVIVKGRENRFGLDGQQVALDPGIPTQRICQRVLAACQDTCNSARARAQASGVRGFQDPDPARLHQMGVLADEFNAALGNTTHFSDLGTEVNGGGAAGGGGGAVVCNAKALEVSVKGKEHRFGFDGRQVALNPAIPIQNICQRVSAGCQATCASAGAAAAATGVKGFSGNDDPVRLRQMGVLADTFNAALGNKTDFTNSPLNLN
jgi:hypothetical protein